MTSGSELHRRGEIIRNLTQEPTSQEAINHSKKIRQAGHIVDKARVSLQHSQRLARALSAISVLTFLIGGAGGVLTYMTEDLSLLAVPIVFGIICFITTVCALLCWYDEVKEYRLKLLEADHAYQEACMEGAE